MEINIWGARGSVPVCGPAFLRHGGATTCIEVALPGASGQTPRRVILDCGTGLTELGKRWGDRGHQALVLQSHMHWDHIQGFPFFAPLFQAQTQLQLWSVPREGQTLRQVLGGQMQPPTFPVGLEVLPAQLAFRDLERAGQARVGELTLRWAEMEHPSGSTAWRLEHRGCSVVFSGDVEVQDGCGPALAALSQGADLLIMDAQYMPEEYPARRGFGHSTPLDAVQVALEAGVRHLLLTHHDPTHGDAALEAKVALARRAARGTGLQVDNAYGRMSVALSPQPCPARRSMALA
jgi:phosphoribosyl 1,2-cyclic phosphodiesterase